MLSIANSVELMPCCATVVSGNSIGWVRTDSLPPYRNAALA